MAAGEPAQDTPVQVRAYAEKSSIEADSDLDGTGDLILSAHSDQSIDALVVSGSAALGAGPVGVGVAAAGSAAVNKITTQVQAFIDGNGVDGISASSVRLSASDTSTIEAVTGTAALSAGFGAVGVAVSVSGSLAHNEIDNDIAAYIINADAVEATGTAAGDGIFIEASEEASIEALTTAASLSTAIGAVGVSISGAGATATNIILTTTNAYIADSTVMSAGDVVLEAMDTSTISAIVATASGAVGGGAVGVGVSIGASLARNFIGWDLILGVVPEEVPAEVQAYISGSTITAAGDLEQRAITDETIEAVVLAGSAAIGAGGVGVGVAGSGVRTTNRIATNVKAFVNESSIINAGSVSLSADDTSKIKAQAGAASISGGFGGVGVAVSIGGATARNQISNDVAAYIDASMVTASAGNIEITARETATINALSTAASVSTAFGIIAIGISGAGATATNIILTTTNSYVTNSTLVSEGDVVLEATDTSTISATVAAASSAVGGGGVGAGSSIGASLARNFIGWDLIAGVEPEEVPAEVQAWISKSSILATGNLIQTATANQNIDAQVLAGSAALAAGGAASSGSGAFVSARNQVSTNVKAYIDGSGTTGIDASGITLLADDTSTITAVGGAAGIAQAFGLVSGQSQSIGASRAQNEISNRVAAFIVNASDVDSDQGNIKITASENATINARSVATAVAQSVGALQGISYSGAGADATNVILTTVKAYVASSDLASSADVIIEALNVSTIDARVAATADALAVGLISFSSSIGSSQARNLIGTALAPADVQAYVLKSSINAVGELAVTATANETIDAKVEADSKALAAGYVAIAASGAFVNVENQVYSNIEAFINGDGALGISADSVVLKAEDTSTITAISGASGIAEAVGVGGSANAIGKSGALNQIGNNVHAYIINADTFVKTAAGDIRVQAIENATINAKSVATSAASSGLSGFSFSRAGADATNVILTTTRAYVESSILDSGAAVDLEAMGTSTIIAIVAAASDAEAGGLPLGLNLSASIGSSQARNLIGVTLEGEIRPADVQAYSQYSGVTAVGELAVTATANETIVAEVVTDSRAVAEGLVAIAASGAFVNVENKVLTNVAAFINGDGTSGITAGSVELLAQDTSTITADAKAASVAESVGLLTSSLSIGGAFAGNEIGNQVEAYIYNAANGITTTSGDISVSASETATINGTATAASHASAESLGFVFSLSGAGSNITNVISTLTNADVENVNLVSAGDVNVTARAELRGSADAAGTANSGIAVAKSSATIQATPKVAAFIGAGADVTAEDSIIVHALSDAEFRASASSSAGGLVGGVGSNATATTTVDVSAFVGDGTSISSGNDVTIRSDSGNLTDADATGKSFAIASGGVTTATSVLTNINDAYIGDDASVNAGRDFTLSAQSLNSADSNVTGGAGGIFVGASTTARTYVNDNTTAAVGDRSEVIADGVLLIEALTSINAHSKAGIETGAAATSNLTLSDTDVVSHASVEVGTDVTLIGDTVEIHAKVSNLGAAGDASSKTIAANSTTDAQSLVDVSSRTEVIIHSGADITGTQRLQIISRQDGVNVDSDADAKIDLGVTGTVLATGHNDLDLDSDVNVHAGSRLISNDVFVQAESPKNDDIYGQTADADAATVVQWVSNRVQQLVKITSNIPFIGWIVKWAYKWVTVWTREILNSDESAILSGELSSDNSINMAGDIFQGASSSPRLVINEDGSFEAIGVTAQIVGNEVIVSDIAGGQGAGNIFLSSPSGAVSGDGTIHKNSNFAMVMIVNRSALNLRVNNISSINPNQIEADLQIESEGSLDSSSFSVVSDLGSVVDSPTIKIENETAGDIILAGVIQNPTGVTAVINLGGDIRGLPAALIEGQEVTLEAVQGQIGEVGNSLKLGLYADEANAALTAAANGGIYLESRLLTIGETDTPVSNSTVIDGVDFSSVVAGGDIDIHAVQAQVLVPSEDPGGAPTLTDVNGTYNFIDVASNGGNVTIAVDSGDMNLGAVRSPLGTSTLIASGSVFNAGSTSTANIVAENIVLTATTGGIGTLTNALDIASSSTGSLTATAQGDIVLTETTGNLVLGTVTSSGQVVLVSAGAILDDNDSSAVDIIAQDLVLNAQGGDIGSINDAIESQVGRLDGSATGGIWLNNQGALTIGGVSELDGVFATTGPIEITANSPLTVAGDVIATGNITLTATESAAAGDDFLLVEGNTVASTAGSVEIRAGDNVDIAGDINALLAIGIFGDFGNLDTAGTIITVRTALASPTNRIFGDIDDDTLTLHSSGAASRVELNGEAGQDTVNVRATGAGSITDIRGGANTDTINLGSLGNSLDGLLGDIDIAGDANDGGTVDLMIKDDTNTLASGDILNLNDDGDAGAYTYDLTATTFERIGSIIPTGLITYGTIETLNLDTSEGVATVNVMFDCGLGEYQHHDAGRERHRQCHQYGCRQQRGDRHRRWLRYR